MGELRELCPPTTITVKLSPEHPVAVGDDIYYGPPADMPHNDRRTVEMLNC